MTESEAIEVICREAGEEEGFVAEVERTGRILPERIALFYAALETLAPLWRGESEVPKRAIRPLVNISGRIYAAAVAHDGTSSDIENLGIEITNHIYNTFGNPFDPHTEVGARLVIEQQFATTAGLPFSLRMGGGYDSSSVEEALIALGTLTVAWRTRATIPSSLAGVMFDIGDAVAGTAGLYPEKVAEIEALGATLNAAVLECLS